MQSAAQASDMIPIPDHANDLFYPDTDGRPMAESDFQREPLSYAISALRRFFHDQDDIYVSGNLLIYYEQGNPKASVAPDVFVVRGAPGHDRRIYKLWEEPKAPDFVLEITSNSSVSEDQGIKRGLYAFLGIEEYWQIDPTGDYLIPSLQGLRLTEGNYWPIPVRDSGDGTLIGASTVLGLELRNTGGQLHFHDPIQDRTLLTYAELAQAAEIAERGREIAERARRIAERGYQNAEQARETAERRAETEARQRAAAEARADVEARQRAAAEARIAELEKSLRNQR
jgi:Uma2 family endonuclease